MIELRGEELIIWNELYKTIHSSERANLNLEIDNLSVGEKYNLYRDGVVLHITEYTRTYSGIEYYKLTIAISSIVNTKMEIDKYHYLLIKFEDEWFLEEIETI